MVFQNGLFPVESGSSGVKPAKGESWFVRLYFVARFKMNDFFIGLSDYPLRQITRSFNGFFVIVIVKLKQKKTIKKRENRDLRNPGWIARNPVENSIYLVNVFFGTPWFVLDIHFLVQTWVITWVRYNYWTSILKIRE